jgi:2-phosphoglycerate kinase
LSGSGKTTIAVELERKLFETGRFAQILDGDNLRTGIKQVISGSPQPTGWKISAAWQRYQSSTSTAE